ncbi:MAG: endonuclease [Eubacterium sp.]|nr:endonuclease [Eubacterium sp.]
MAKKEKKKRSFFGKLIRFILFLILILVLLVCGFFGFLTVKEYKPADIVPAETKGASAENEIAVSDEQTIMSWNIGYGALGDNADFFMDGGTSVMTADAVRLAENLENIRYEINLVSPDFALLQEVDTGSSRSHFADEQADIVNEFQQYESAFGYNFKVPFVPYPWPPIGTVNSGILTLSDTTINDPVRVALPCPFEWPVRLANLKRCLLVSRIPILDSEKELVLINLHLEAYDSGEGKTAQTKVLKDFMEQELAKGNYVIAGGDFNQSLSEEDRLKYPQQEGKWAAGVMDTEQFSAGWQFITDNSAPTCRSLDQSYKDADKSTFQYYMIDGFIVSPNIQVNSVETQDLDFVSSDHNPVVMKFKLK